MMMAKEEQHTFSAQYFKLSINQFRSGKACECVPPLNWNHSHIGDPENCVLQDKMNIKKMYFSAITDHNYSICPDMSELSFGMLVDGLEESDGVRYMAGCDVMISFPAPIFWNGWFLVTPRTGHPDLDPVRFVLQARIPGGGWRPVGSSGYARILVSTALFHTSYDMTTERGARVDFDLYRLRLGSIWQSTAVALSLGAAGMARFERLGKHIACLHFFSWVVLHVMRARHYAVAKQWAGVAVFLALAAMQLGNLLLCRREWWLRLAFWSP